MKEHSTPENRFPGLAVDGECENGHQATIADRGLPHMGHCSECDGQVLWYEVDDE